MFHRQTPLTDRPHAPEPGARIFILSPARLTGARGARILAGTARAGFMSALSDGDAVPIGEVFSFVSSLYYRGKRTYARAFGMGGPGVEPVLVVTPDGLIGDDAPVTLERLRRFAGVDLGPANEAFVAATSASARALASRAPDGAEFVLLGSIATAKYLEPLVQVMGPRLLVPRDFAGRGDTSRGGLLLRAAAAGTELAYVRALDAERHGRRPPRLDPATRPARR